MKTLYVLRHAKAEAGIKHAWDPADDKNRSLTASGIEDARSVGAWFARKGIRPGVALVSDATRTVETWKHVNENARMDVPLRLIPALYLASADEITSIVKELPNSFTSVLVVAHNPGIADLVGEDMSTSALATANNVVEWNVFDPLSVRWRVRNFR
jgi:phosphohistidine phosphatase